ncbi:hypothetical protein Tco_0925645 [Tanacetum coccineum]|uniref:Uncharacterized protein n=1 Tax=Tanacetum coccineum TaxID=301880 RepID=A0ABQ5D7G2_9ASTR
MKVEESLNVTFDESPPPTKLSPLVDDDVGEEEAIKRNTKVLRTLVMCEEQLNYVEMGGVDVHCSVDEYGDWGKAHCGDSVVAIEDLAARTHVLSGGDTHDRVITVRCLATRGRAGGVGSDGHDAECLFEERAGALDRVGDFRERMLLHYSELEVSSEGHKEFYTIGHGDHGTLLGRGGDACDMRRRVLCVSGAGLILIDSGVGHTASTFFNVLVHFVELQFFLIVLFWVNKSDFGILKVLWGNFVGFDGFWWGLCGDMGGCDVKCIKICRIDYCKGVSKNEREWRRDYEGGGILMGGNGKGVVRLYLEGVSGAECGLIMSGGVWGVVGRYRDIGKKGMRDLDRGGMEWLGKWMDVRGCVYKRGDGSGEYWWWVPIHCKETSIRRRL